MSLSVLALLSQHARLPEPARPLPPAWHLSGMARWLPEPQSPPGMARWSRLDRYGQVLCEVTAAVVDKTSISPQTGLFVASERSCLETNSQFDWELITKGPRRCSPKLFPYTLPGSGASEAAMHLGLGGPYAVFTGGPGAALTSFVAAWDSLAAQETPEVVVAAADVLGPHTVRTWQSQGAWPEPPRPPAAEGAAALRLGLGHDPRPGPRFAVEAFFDPPGRRDWVSALGELLPRLEGGCGRVIDASLTPIEELPRACEAILGPEVECLALAYRVGQCGAALGLLGLLSALEEAGSTLLVARDRGCMAWLCINPLRSN